VVYELVRPSVHNTVALAMGLAVPASWTLARWLVRRRVDPIGLVSALSFAVACLVSALSGGNPLILELKDPVLTGALGMACLVSILLRRPLQLAVLRPLASRNSLARAAVADPARTQHSSMITAHVGVILLIRAAALAVIALTVSVGTYVLVARPVGWGIIESEPR
jgi:hypothetical protein